MRSPPASCSRASRSIGKVRRLEHTNMGCPVYAGRPEFVFGRLEHRAYPQAAVILKKAGVRPPNVLMPKAVDYLLILW